MSTDPSERPDDNASSPQPPASSDAAPPPTAGEANNAAGGEGPSRRTVLIGSQRDPAAYRPKPRRDWVPAVKKPEPTPPAPQAAAPPTPASPSPAAPALTPARAAAAADVGSAGVAAVDPASTLVFASSAVLSVADTVAADMSAGSAPLGSGSDARQAAPPRQSDPRGGSPPHEQPRREPPQHRTARAFSQESAAQTVSGGPQAGSALPSSPAAAGSTGAAASEAAQGASEASPDEDVRPRDRRRRDRQREQADRRAKLAVPDTRSKITPPSVRAGLSPDLEAEYLAAMGEVAIDDLIKRDDSVSQQAALEPDSRVSGRVVAVRGNEAFLELGGREQGVLSIHEMPEPPAIGTSLDVFVVRFNAEDGLYDVRLPHMAADVGDWADIEEGMIVEARVTGHNAGGLECEVNHIRGFIPISQISLYRVEHTEEFVGQKFNCLVTEVNPQRRNLVLSHRAVLEREREESRASLLASLEPGQVREGVVRKIMDFGAFVDLGGGVDGMVHVSQIAWGRISHPSEALSEGQPIKVVVQKVDKETGKISLSLRETLENPWTEIEKKYPANSPVTGRVSRIMEFGAFVELEPGVEGLIHISELAPRRVWRVTDVVKEGDEVTAMVLGIDAQARRISLSLKALAAKPEPVKAEDAEEAALPAKKEPRFKGPLKGGLGRSEGGERFGLKW